MNKECAMYLNATKGRFNKDKSALVEKGIKVAYEVMWEINAKTGIAMEKFDKLVEMEDGEVSVAIAVYDQVLTKEQIATIKGIMEGKGLANVEELVIEGEEEDTKFYSTLKKETTLTFTEAELQELAERFYIQMEILFEKEYGPVDEGTKNILEKLLRAGGFKKFSRAIETLAKNGIKVED